MNNFFSLLHLTRELNESLVGWSFVSAISRRKRLLEIEFAKNDRTVDLVFHAGVTPALFMRDHRGVKKNNLAVFFEDLEGCVVTDVQLDPDDRILRICFGNGLHLVFYMFAASNVYLMNGDDITDRFLHRAIPAIKSVAKESVSTPRDLKSHILAIEPKFPRHLISLLSKEKLESLPEGDLQQLVTSWVYEMTSKPVFRVLESGQLCLLPEHVVPVPDLRCFTTINDAIRESWYQREVLQVQVSEQRLLQAQLDTAFAKLLAMKEQLDRSGIVVSRASEYENIGHILLTYSYLGTADSNIIEVEDPFNPPQKRRISVKKDVSYSENAQVYYAKAKDARKSLEANQLRMVETQRRLDILSRLRTELSHISDSRSLDRWTKDHSAELALFRSQSTQSNAESVPWRVLMCQGYEVRIGKSAAGNDQLTQAAHKEDIWMHARHVSGSHVVIRMNRNTGFPQLPVLEEVAGWAAFYSKARTSSLAPVAYTKRKYVRKPKGAAPGSVLMDKEQVLLVLPQKPVFESSLE